MNSPIVAVTTCSSPEEARKVAHGLTEAGLAACVNILPGISSIYRWKGQIEEAAEILLIVKTRSGLLPELQRRLGELHSYEVPELIVLPITGGSPAYLAWLAEETSAAAATLP